MKFLKKRLLSILLMLAVSISLLDADVLLGQTRSGPQNDAAQTADQVLETDYNLAAENTAENSSGSIDDSDISQMDRDGLEEMAEMAGISTDDEAISSLDDDALLALVESSLAADGGETTAESLSYDGEPQLFDSEETAEINPEEHPEAYDEDGNLTIPFDQVYPETVENGEVAYDSASVLVKMANDAVLTEGMQNAGVVSLEAIVPMADDTWYEAALREGADVQTAVEALRALDEVELVDYNYICETAAMDDYTEIPENLASNRRAADQWYLNYCGFSEAQAELTHPGGSPDVIVAVIDTGVDYDHEDLSKNIWKNTDEIPNNGIDDDGNGYVDDYYGVNIVSGKGNGDDDNGHGTHVAGIIAAENNNLGTVGIAYNTTIMPVKAAAASGSFNQSAIARAILYAYENGADVINMSFGGTALSIAVQDALETAYTQCVLVAAAGNEGVPDETYSNAAPSYPAALPYVLGVMSVDQNGQESEFTNYDVKLNTETEYEVYAPGEDITSTIPDNRYASWDGTSMAAPVIAAMAALLRSEYPDTAAYPTKYIYGQLVGTSEDSAVPYFADEHNVPCIVNLYDAVTKTPAPDVRVSDYSIFDTAGLPGDTGNNNGDGVIDAGETVALGFTLHNRWGASRDTIVKVDTLSDAGIADPYVTIVEDSVNYGSVGTYSDQDCGKVYTDVVQTGWENPFYLQIAADCPNNYIVKLNVYVTGHNGWNTRDTAAYVSKITIFLTIRSGTVLPRIISQDMTLTADHLYIISNSTLIEEGVTVTVEPGTNIQFWSNDPSDPYAEQYNVYLKVAGKLLINGTSEQHVKLYPSDLMYNYTVQLGETDSGYISMKYADVTNLRYTVNNATGISYAENCRFDQNTSQLYTRQSLSSGVRTSEAGRDIGYFGYVKNSVFYKLRYYLGDEEINDALLDSGTYDTCAFVDCAIVNGTGMGGCPKFTNCLFYGNAYEENGNILSGSKLHSYGDGSYYSGNAFLNRVATDPNADHWMRIYADGDYAGTTTTFGGNYWGASSDEAMDLQIYDYYDDFNLSKLDTSNSLTEAPENTFPFVVSVEIVNSYGETVTTVGNEPVSVTVKFNRDMDTTIPLDVYFGSSYPYKDYKVSGSYTDARTWTGSIVITGVSANGTEYFSISNGRSAEDDLEFFEDWYRFSFNVDYTSAQSMTLQGDATAAGIRLSWTQDDFDTLMGYNLYRAADGDGEYTRVNSSVIPAETRTWVDSAVASNTRYDYYFTVVQTNLTESASRGKVSVETGKVGSPFVDVQNSDDYFYEPVLWAAENGIVYGTSDTTFSPYDVCTRAQVVTFLYRTAGEPAITDTTNPFTDVKPDDYFYDAVLWGYQNGIVYGTSDTTFSPDDQVTRAQFITFLYRFAHEPEVTDRTSPFADLPANEYYTDAVLWGAQNGVVYGVDDNHFAPGDTCTRAQVVTFLHRYKNPE